MNLFQRIRKPFVGDADDEPAVFGQRGYSIGDLLRDRREELELDLESIGDTLRIKPVYLAALEQGQAQDLPGPTYAIGFIRAYADFLGLDAERVLERYKAETAEVHSRPDLTLPVPLGARSLPGGPILLVGLILALCGYGTWYYLSTGERSRPERVVAVPAELRQPLPQSTGPEGVGASPSRIGPDLATPSDSPSVRDAAAGSQAGGLVASPAIAAAPSPTVSAKVAPAGISGPVPASGAKPNPGNAVPAAVASASPGPAGDIGGSGDPSQASGRIDIRALADCWIQVRAGDQSIVFSRVLKAGEIYHVPRGGLFLRTGNAGALSVAVDGKPAPAIGAIGTLRRNVALDPEALMAGTAVHG